MLDLVAESFRGGWPVLLAAAFGFPFALWSGAKRPGRLGVILIGVAIVVILLGLAARQYLFGALWADCRVPAARGALEAQILGTLGFGAVGAFGLGLLCGALWDKLKVASIIIFVSAVPMVVVLVYFLFAGSGMSAANCFTR